MNFKLLVNLLICDKHSHERNLHKSKEKEAKKHLKARKMPFVDTRCI